MWSIEDTISSLIEQTNRDVITWYYESDEKYYGCRETNIRVYNRKNGCFKMELNDIRHYNQNTELGRNFISSIKANIERNYNKEIMEKYGSKRTN